MPYLDNDVGYQGTDTSFNSAKTVKAEPIRQQILNSMRKNPALGFSTTEMAKLLDRPYCSVQPRMTELKNRNQIEDSGRRTKTKYNKEEIVWQLKWLLPPIQPVGEIT